MSTLNDEVKKEKLTQFVADAEMFEAVKEELLKGMYSNGVIQEGVEHNPMVNWALSLGLNRDNIPNDVIGSKLVAMSEGLQFIESSLAKIKENYKPSTPKDKEEGTNPAR